MREFDEVASAASVERAMAALLANGIEAELVPDGAAARSRVLELVPPGAQVMLGTSRTLELTGLVSEPEGRGGSDAVVPQKVAPDLDAGMRRVMEYALPLEENRAQQAYGRGSGANKVLIISREIRPNRIRLIFVSESIGFSAGAAL